MAVIAVTGATGQLGRLVVAALKARAPAGTSVRAVVRTPSKAADLGVEARAGDYEDRAALAAALAGADTVVLISSSELGKRAAQHANVLAAAREAGVKHVVYTSLINADAWSADSLLAREHRETEAALRASSGLAWTVLRNGWYFENFAGSIASGAASGTVIGAAGDGKYSAATRADYADAAATVALDAAKHAGKVYELGGDHAFTAADLAAEIARQAGRPVAYKNLSEADYAHALASYGLPAPIAHMLAQSDAAVPTGILFTDRKDLATLAGHPTATLASAVAGILAGAKSAH